MSSHNEWLQFVVVATMRPRRYVCNRYYKKHCGPNCYLKIVTPPSLLRLPLHPTVWNRDIRLPWHVNLVYSTWIVYTIQPFTRPLFRLRHHHKHHPHHHHLFRPRVQSSTTTTFCRLLVETDQMVLPFRSRVDDRHRCAHARENIHFLHLHSTKKSTRSFATPFLFWLYHRIIYITSTYWGDP